MIALTICAQVLALVLRFTAARAYAAWVIALGALPALGQMAVYFWQGAKRGGTVMTASDAQFLSVEAAILVLAVLSGWRHSRLFFWLAWMVNLALIGVFAYVIFLWHPFA